MASTSALTLALTSASPSETALNSASVSPRLTSRLIAPFAGEVELLDTITGVDRRAAEYIIAEIGVDMARFGNSARLASWAGRCPGHHESAGKHKSGRSRPGSKWLAAIMAQCAEAAGRSKNTYLGAQFQRLRGRRGHPKARKAVEHSILVAAYHVLDRHAAYQDLSTSRKLSGNR